MSVRTSPVAAAAPAMPARSALFGASALGRWLVTLLLTVLAVATLYPLFFTLLTSLKSRSDFAQNPLGFTADLTLDNYVAAFERMNVPRLLLNSVVTTAGGLLISTVAALFLAYAVTKLRIRGGNLIFLFIIAMLVIPSQVIIYPLYETILTFGMGGTYQGLIFTYAAFGLPLGTYLLAAYFRAVPDDLIEAARLDGAGELRILFSIMLPVSLPAIAAISILNFVWMWNDLLLPLVIMGGSDNKTLMVGVSLLSGQYDVSIPLVSAGLVIALAPVVLVYFVFQRQILSGAIAGAVR
ncbi:carbohydrate ABC transporter permease [Prosthecomicrobium pneumaticum]|uniref:ABC-type glycerol-3-phosphate transport system permease component n=1 Tax=Prosthecomicrobium pneumaticum TaxID=81895 RepID=A0A7W9FMM0_9HYPH|nr:carbohydrate ABC transporter permease [Prosthecomicrobium pneumaticum]MBB5753406.1 ABC-type glycerol-3-phosphate transport system permease component [Prosthecomicrobium pneumaticum]